MTYGKAIKHAHQHFKRHGGKYFAAAKGMHKMYSSYRSKGSKSKGNEQSSAGLHPQDIGGITTYMRHRLGPKHTPKFEKQSGPCNIQIDQSYHLVVNAGQQSFQDVPCMWAQGIGTNGQWQGDLGFVFQASNRQRTSQYSATAGSSVGLNYKTFVSYSSQQIYYRNNSVHPMVLTLYDYECKEDTSYGTVSAMQDNLGADGTQNLAVSQGPSIFNPGYKPTDSSTFKQVYKIKRVKQLILNGGECHQHKSKVTYNKLIDQARLEEFIGSTNAQLYAKGITTGVLARFHMFPSPAVTSGVDLTDGALTTYSQNRIYYRITEATATHNEISNQYVTATVGNFKYADEMAGQVMVEGTGFTAGGGHA